MLNHRMQYGAAIIDNGVVVDGETIELTGENVGYNLLNNGRRIPVRRITAAEYRLSKEAQEYYRERVWIAL
jgi:hypothetical protein